MAPRTISTQELYVNNMLHLQAQDLPNTPINVRAVLKPYTTMGYKVMRYVTDAVTGSMQAVLKL